MAADGLHSAIRRMAGLEGAHARPRAQRHAPSLPRGALAAPFVEVHWADGAEAYVTPVAPDEIGVALLWSGGARYDALLARFPELAARLAGAPPELHRGAGASARAAAPLAPGVALVGDAAGYLDRSPAKGSRSASAAPTRWSTRSRAARRSRTTSAPIARCRAATTR